MAREFKETAHLKTNTDAFSEGYDRIFGKKEVKSKAAHYKVVNGEVVEMSEEEAIKSTKHVSAGMCGEFGMSTFDDKAYKENLERILKNKESSSESQTSKISSGN